MASARFDLLSQCNLKCMHCYAAEMYNHRQHPLLNSEDIFTILRNLSTDGVQGLNILGGEPFLHPEIKKILRFACDEGFRVSITTNGTTIRKEDVPLFVGLPLQNIFFSLDGSNPQVNDQIRGKGTFEKAVETLKAFLSEKEKQDSSLQVTVNTVLTKINANDILNIIRFCASCGVNGYRLIRLDLSGNAAANSEELRMQAEEEFGIAEQVVSQIPNYPDIQFYTLTDKPKVLEYFYEKYSVVFPVHITGCKGCSTEIYVQPNGDIFPCYSTTGDSNVVRNGHLRYTRLNALEPRGSPIWNSEYFKQFRETFHLDRETYKGYVPCETCPYLLTICYPCPLGSVGTPFKEDLCLIADQKLRKEST